MTLDPESRVRALFAERYGRPPERVVPVSAHGSARRYWRIFGAEAGPVVGAYGPEPEENRAFLSFSRAFRGLGLPVPEVYAADEPSGVWLEQDLGDRTLFDVLSAARHDGEAFPPSVLPLYRRVLEILPRFQVEGAEAVDFGAAHPREAFDRQSILWDLNYFKYHFLKLAGIPFNEARLERDFGRLARFLLEAPSGYFLYRDFQSRNVMVLEGRPWFIDYQGGRRGALQYDVASLLYDAKADIPDPVREELLAQYLDAAEAVVRLDRDAFRERYPGFVLIRVMQAMGAYGYRGFYERKLHFLQSVPYAARTLGRLLDAGLPLDLPELEAAFRRIAEAWAERDPEEWAGWPELAAPDATGDRAVRRAAAPGGASRPGVSPARDRSAAAEPASDRDVDLSVRVASFSFRHGYPPDETGHGGPIFDCRVLPNPGRLEAYRDSTGLDEDTIAFLEAREETHRFWELVHPLAEAQVREFLERGHAELTIHFGCTGGQHRSPYFAERLGRHLREKFPRVRLEVVHRERAAWPGRDAAEGRGPADGEAASDPAG